MGKPVALGAAASSAWYYQYQQGQQVLAHWGVEHAGRIRLAPRCKLLKLDKASVTDETRTDAAGAAEMAGTSMGRYLEIGGVNFPIRWERDLTGAPGFVHARHALIQDASYDWGNATAATNDWDYAIFFQDDGGTTILAFDLEHAVVANAEDLRQRASIAPTINGFRSYFAELSR